MIIGVDRGEIVGPRYICEIERQRRGRDRGRRRIDVGDLYEGAGEALIAAGRWRQVDERDRVTQRIERRAQGGRQVGEIACLGDRSWSKTRPVTPSTSARRNNTAPVSGSMKACQFSIPQSGSAAENNASTTT